MQPACRGASMRGERHRWLCPQHLLRGLLTVVTCLQEPAVLNCWELSYSYSGSGQHLWQSDRPVSWSVQYTVHHRCCFSSSSMALTSPTTVVVRRLQTGEYRSPPCDSTIVADKVKTTWLPCCPQYRLSKSPPLGRLVVSRQASYSLQISKCVT